MTFAAWLTLVVVLAVMLALASERVSSPVAVLGGVTVLLLAGVIDSRQALSGFASEAPLTIAALYVLATAAAATGALDRLTARALGDRAPPGVQDRPTRRELIRLVLPPATLSTVVPNTPIVGLVAPQVATWARQSRRPPSWYLLGLNAAVQLGGMVTLIGTTTNVVVSGLLTDAGQPPLGLFEITPVALPVALAGLAVVLALGTVTAPTRRPPSSAYDADARDFTLEMVVARGGPLVGCSIGRAGLRNLDGVFLVDVVRNGRSLGPVGPEQTLDGGDRLLFAGNVTRVLDLQRLAGLASAESPHFSVPNGDRRFFEAVLATSSTLVGSTLKESDFRARMGGAVLAIHRAGERVNGKLGQVRLRSGDVLLILAGDDFASRVRQDNDFLAVAPVGGPPPPRRELSRRTAMVLGGFLVVAGTGLLPVFQAALLAAFAVVALRVLTPAEAREAVDLNVVVTIAASFGLGAAMTASGLAAAVADLLTRALQGLGAVGVLAGVLVATVVVTQVVTNNATAVVMFPIALSAASAAGGDVRTYALAVAIGASLSFMTPFGYQTNLLVQGLAGYHFRDFVPLGAAVAGVCACVAVLALSVWPGG